MGHMANIHAEVVVNKMKVVCVASPQSRFATIASRIRQMQQWVGEFQVLKCSRSTSFRVQCAKLEGAERWQPATLSSLHWVSAVGLLIGALQTTQWIKSLGSLTLNLCLWILYGMLKCPHVIVVLSRVLETLKSWYNYVIISKSIYSSRSCKF